MQETEIGLYMCVGLGTIRAKPDCADKLFVPTSLDLIPFVVQIVDVSLVAAEQAVIA